MFPQQASWRRCSGGCVCRTLGSSFTDHRSRQQRERASAFTLLELLIVVGIIAILLVLLAPAFTNIKSAGNVTSAAYTIKGALNTGTSDQDQQHLHMGRFLRGRCLSGVSASCAGPAMHRLCRQTNHVDCCVKGWNQSRSRCNF